jgi:ArsR family transcriptional regulator
VSVVEKDFCQYALFMKALSDETRLKIFNMLADGELCACKILEDFDITQPTLSYHMKILTESGLVNSRRDGVWMKYSINKDNLQSIKQMFDDICSNISNQTNCTKKC